jgi:DNA-binding MarR family transcriptional regulator
MSSGTETATLRKEIVRTVERDLNEQMAHYHAAIAAWVGLTMADHKVFDLICATGPLTAGQLAKLTNLTTGGVTGLVDRLEHAGFVRRERDPQDRRRVIIQPSPNVQSLATILRSLSAALAEVSSRYTDQELTTILDFSERIVAVFQAETAKLRRDDAEV